jgi:hypothetical protein
VDDASDATLDLVRYQETYDIGPLDWHMIDASGTPQQTLQRCKENFGAAETGLSSSQLDPP